MGSLMKISQDIIFFDHINNWHFEMPTESLSVLQLKYSWRKIEEFGKFILKPLIIMANKPGWQN